MRFVVDQDVCIGCGACECTCPAVFRLEEGVSSVYVDPVPAEQVADAIMAEDQCPVMAISHE